MERSGKQPKIFAVVLNHNGQDVLKKCLASLFKCDYPNLEIVVVDNNSADGSFESAKADFSKANFIKNQENLGHSAGNNTGIRFALERMADYVFLLGNDIEIEPGLLENLINIAEKDEKIGLVSPIIFNKKNKQIWFSGGKISWLKAKVFYEKKARTKERYSSDFLTSRALLVKKKVFEKVGLFDESYFLYFGDADLSFRAGKAGFEKLVSASSWAYRLEKEEQGQKNKIYWLTISNLIFFKKNTPTFLRPWTALCLLIRKIRNRLDNLNGKNKLAPAVKKAYDDFAGVKI